MKAQLASIRPDGGRLGIHPLDIRGRFMRWRRIVFAALIAFYGVAPAITVDGHPALQLDFDHRKFFLVGKTFNAQDFWIVLFPAAGFLFFLLLLTAWRGRLWCGWACPQTVYLEGVYRPIERFFDGPRERRLKLAGSPWTAGRVARLVGKHASYLAVSIAIAHVAAAIFVSYRELGAMMTESPAAHPLAFGWTTAFTAILYFNFAWFREQFCVVLCPYGRLQSVLHDRQSITVAYDAGRGEPRGRIKADGPRQGDCVDCKRCVYACPTAIDIRDGLQMECLACAQCVDVCDEVMRKVGRPEGLIRYASLAQFAGETPRIARPRIFVYGALTLLAFSVTALALTNRTPFEANVLRLRGIPYVIEAASVRNQFEVHLINKAPHEATFHLVLTGAEGIDTQFARNSINLKSLEATTVPLVVTLPSRIAHGNVPLTLTVTTDEPGVVKKFTVPFLGPPN